MTRRALLVLEDGSHFEGQAFGAAAQAYGEVVFNTSMTGYQEALTDPSYAGQVLVMTYPLQGNYGINETDFESRRIQVRGYVVREDCDLPSHWRSRRTLHEYLAEAGVPGIAGIDTRALTRRLRSSGVMMGMVTSGETAEQALGRLAELPRYDSTDYVPLVSTGTPAEWPAANAGGLRIAVVDLGVKHNIMRILSRLGCRPVVLPCRSTAEEVLATNPDGVLLSPGPGDPALLDYAAATASGLIGRVPVMGICLGHQVVARALGAGTFKLKFGHRGANHPVRDIATGRVYITAQNHGYAVDPDGLPAAAVVSHVNLNDGTVEGLEHREAPLLTIQYHSEASPGPLDNVYLFERFLQMVAARPARGG